MCLLLIFFGKKFPCSLQTIAESGKGFTKAVVVYFLLLQLVKDYLDLGSCIYLAALNNIYTKELYGELVLRS